MGNISPSPDAQKLAALFTSHFGNAPESVEPLAASGSDRRIHRLRGAGRSVIGVVNGDISENRAFLGFSKHFRAEGLPVPAIFAESADLGAYLEEDLGDTTLFEFLLAGRTPDSNEVPPAAAAIYEAAVRMLPEFQVRAGRGIDESLCHPRSRFDRQSMMWDLNYFKYYFLKLAQVPFHEQALEDDFVALTGFLLTAPSEFFVYRDFQSRNIMVRDGAPWFIDYQGGRRGALQYDLASVLVDAKADLPMEFRAHLVGVYLQALEKHHPVSRGQFLEHLDGFILIRILQAMGAYGFRGFYERRTHFLQSVPYAIRNLESLLGAARIPVRLPALFDVLHSITRSTRLREIARVALPLTVRIESFSYKHGPPADESGHGGGFVFDCRILPNPGREPRYAGLAGDDAEVVSWLEARDEVHSFLTRVRDLTGQVVEGYSRRNFTHLSIAFGCTGGQHRSVYCATQLAKHLAQHGALRVDLRHRDVKRIQKTTTEPRAAT
ncbi:MAG: RapZ C-terminal domain-containing protein [Opitutaceae bacterium]